MSDARRAGLEGGLRRLGEAQARRFDSSAEVLRRPDEDEHGVRADEADDGRAHGAERQPRVLEGYRHGQHARPQAALQEMR